MTTARSLLERLVEWGDTPATEVSPHLHKVVPIIDDARAYLASTKDAPVVEASYNFYRDGDRWYGYETYEPGCVKVRIPVPAHLLNPPVVEGEVIE